MVPGHVRGRLFCDTSEGLQSESCAEARVCAETSNSSKGCGFPVGEGCDSATRHDARRRSVSARLVSSRTCARLGL